MQREELRLYKYLFMSDFEYTPIQLRIATTFGEYSTYSSNPERPRVRKRKGYRKKEAIRILNDIYPGGHSKVGHLSAPEVWLLTRTYPRRYCPGAANRFLLAIARDLKLSPSPKWWRVRHKLTSSTSIQRAESPR